MPVIQDPRRAAARTRLAFGAMIALPACRAQDDSFSVPEADLPKVLSLLCATEAFTVNTDCECKGPILELDQCSPNPRRWVEQAATLELEYDESCMLHLDDALLDFVDDGGLSCSPDPALSIEWASCERECQVYTGTKTEGETCIRAGRRMSTCAQGLACGADDRCHLPCDTPLVIPAGGACGYSLGLLHERCEVGTVCSGDPGTCVVPQGAGDPCGRAATACADGAACSTELVCVPQFLQGQACSDHDECASGVCDGACQSPDPYRCAGFFW